jgi:hypothetical protein
MGNESYRRFITTMAVGWAVTVVGVGVAGTTWLVESRGWERTEGLWFGIAVFVAGLFVAVLAGVALLAVALHERGRR